jgi:hypothetical protein
VPGSGDLETARIPVFASLPSKLEKPQIASRNYVFRELRLVGLDPRNVGSSDRGLFTPLHEVRTLARHCAGGIILGYRQYWAQKATHIDREGTEIVVRPFPGTYYAPTPWNQLETGILFGLGLPLLVLKEKGVFGGVFDVGSSDVFVYDMPMPGEDWNESSDSLNNEDESGGFLAALLRWQALVRNHYYDTP